MTLIDQFLGVHVAAGTVALATFLVPIVTVKGGGTHRRAGRAFVTAMAVICGTGAVVSTFRLATESRPGVRAGAWFLLFVTVLSASATWKGIRVLRFKNSGPNRNPVDLLMSALLVPMGLWIGYLGLRYRNVVFLFFSLAAIDGVQSVRHWLNPAKPRLHWFFEHMDGMLGASIAALTAFATLGARNLGLTGLGVLAWIGPSLVLVPVSILMTRRYRRLFGLEPGAVSTRPAPVAEVAGTVSPPAVRAVSGAPSASAS
jgi:hypothetical protein